MDYRMVFQNRTEVGKLVLLPHNVWIHDRTICREATKQEQMKSKELHRETTPERNRNILKRKTKQISC